SRIEGEWQRCRSGYLSAHDPPRDAGLTQLSEHDEYSERGCRSSNDFQRGQKSTTNFCGCIQWWWKPDPRLDGCGAMANESAGWKSSCDDAGSKPGAFD